MFERKRKARKEIRVKKKDHIKIWIRIGEEWRSKVGMVLLG